MINGFPSGIRNVHNQEDANPAVQLFGRRFFADQQMLELLAEFFLVATSDKIIGEQACESLLPSINRLRNWPDDHPELKYSPKAKLNLKLFAFLGTSRLETRHETHRSHCEDLWGQLQDKIDSDDNDGEDILRILSNLFLGFWGCGAQRTWCTQSFLPFCKGLLANEVIWNESVVRRRDRDIHSWDSVIDEFSTFFSINKHRFYSRGGEVLYLQLCNALRQTPADIETWLERHSVDGTRLGFTAEEADPDKLHAALQQALGDFFARTPKTLNKLADFIDSEVESETSRSSDCGGAGEARSVNCGWCAEDSWREGYLFAVELLRILKANVDIMETVELLQIACSLQVMRSLAAQSYRYSSNVDNTSDGFNYRILISDPEGSNRKLKDFSRTSLVYISGEIYNAIRISEIKDNLDNNRLASIYREADNRYGYKLYRRIGKSIGLIVPRRGNGMRFILNDKILRYLVLSLVPTKRMTYDTFKKQIELHHGFVFDEESLKRSDSWKAQAAQLVSSDNSDIYLEQMLEASGVLVQLSDSCSLVKNPYFIEGE